MTGREQSGKPWQPNFLALIQQQHIHLNNNSGEVSNYTKSRINELFNYSSHFDVQENRFALMINYKDYYKNINSMGYHIKQ